MYHFRIRSRWLTASSEGTGLGNSIAIPDQGWHTWRIEWDRRSNNWATETITWYMDGQQFQQLTGSQLTQDIWNALAHSSLYFILNVAVGGTWVSCFCFLLKVLIYYHC